MKTLGNSLHKLILLVALLTLSTAMLLSCGSNKADVRSEEMIRLMYNVNSETVLLSEENYEILVHALEPYMTEACLNRVFANRIFGDAHRYSVERGVDISVQKIIYTGEQNKLGRTFRYYRAELKVGSEETAHVDVLIDISEDTDWKADYILIENDPFSFSDVKRTK